MRPALDVDALGMKMLFLEVNVYLARGGIESLFFQRKLRLYLEKIEKFITGRGKNPITINDLKTRLHELNVDFPELAKRRLKVEEIMALPLFNHRCDEIMFWIHEQEALLTAGRGHEQKLDEFRKNMATQWSMVMRVNELADILLLGEHRKRDYILDRKDALNDSWQRLNQLSVNKDSQLIELPQSTLELPDESSEVDQRHGEINTNLQTGSDNSNLDPMNVLDDVLKYFVIDTKEFTDIYEEIRSYTNKVEIVVQKPDQKIAILEELETLHRSFNKRLSNLCSRRGILEEHLRTITNR